MTHRLRSFLNLYWLRPENGLLCTFKSRAFQDCPFVSPSLDLSCGDGLFMFLHLGGSVDPDFDYFASTRAREFTHSGDFVDIYDSYSDAYSPEITERPGVVVEYGTDWKRALLDKASKLGIYRNLVLHDNNVRPLPFDDEAFSTVYSNSVYWISDVEGLVSEIARILRPGGRAILEVMTPHMLDTLDELAAYLSPRAISILDRKRRETMPGSRAFAEWMEVMRGCGLRVEDVRCVYPHKVLVDIWNVGLRPISHLLVQMSDSMTREDRRRIKEEWVEIFFELFEPLLAVEETYSLERAPYLLFVLAR